MKYTCPMHPEIVSNKPGRCDICGMQLVDRKKVTHTSTHQQSSENSYRPLIIVVSIIVLVAIAISWRDYVSHMFSVSRLITYIMSGFFITFSTFKLLDIRGFAMGYREYDLIAKKFYEWGYVYPFLELLFGLIMIVAPHSRDIIALEVVIMTISGIGVYQKIQKKEPFMCACLGTVFKLPLTYVTLVEDFGMAALGVALLMM